MPLLDAKCTNCGAILKVDSSKDAAICSYCGSAYVVDNAIQNYYVTNNIYTQNVTVQENKHDFQIEAGKLVKYMGVSKEVIIPDSVETIGKYCFADMNIVSVIIPETVTRIECGAFSGCQSLVKVNVPKAVKRIERGAFSRCSALIEIDISNVNELEADCFMRCTSLEKIRLSNELESIMPECFAYCTSLANINTPSKLKRIERAAFENCSNLKFFDFVESIKYIAMRAFSNSGLQDANVRLPITLECYDSMSETCENVKVDSLETFARVALVGNGAQFLSTPYGNKIERTVRDSRRENNKCLFCGGNFKGLLTKKCARCGKIKSY